jgi:hypothetical protein
MHCVFSLPGVTFTGPKVTEYSGPIEPPLPVLPPAPPAPPPLLVPVVVAVTEPQPAARTKRPRTGKATFDMSAPCWICGVSPTSAGAR